MASQTKERGMIFNAEMVRALLDGRKTQTRRPLNPQPDISPEWDSEKQHCEFYIADELVHTQICPFGQRGDRIWVRETFRLFDHSDECGASDHCSCPPTGTPIYRADFDDMESKWTPSIHMPRSASRITLEITEVRVERLQDMTQQDALAEGCEHEGWVPTYSDPDNSGMHESISARDNYADLWDSLYGNWNDNPWVWVISFEVVN